VHADTLSPGTQLAGRFRIEDLVGETPRSQTWRALDRILDRSVSVQVIASDDDSSVAFLMAARAATAVDDPRFLRVLDAAREADNTYVVREWARGVALDTVLQQGPLPPPRAVELVREVAEALAAAHRVGVQHGRIDPSRIIVKHNGAIRVLGLATDLALHAPATAPGTGAPGAPAGGISAPAPPAGAPSGSTAGTSPGFSAAAANGAPNPGGEPSDHRQAEHAEQARQADVTALGRLLYACLVARWPGGRDLGLPSAPTEHGRLLRPRQVRAGVPPAVDDVVDRILGTPPRHHATPLATADDVALVLAGLSDGTETVQAYADDVVTPHSVLPTAPDPTGPPPAIHQVLPPRTGPSAPSATPDPPPPHTGARLPVWVGVALLVALTVVLGILVSQVGSGVLPTFEPDNRSAPSSTRSSADPDGAKPLQIAAVSDFDPQGDDGAENPDEVPAAHDGDPTTAWTTSTYLNFSTLGNLKDGVGLLIDLGKQREVTTVDLTLSGGPTAFTVYADPGASSPPDTVDDLTAVDEVSTKPAAPDEAVQASVTSDDPVRTRYLVVWLTDLPPNGEGDFEGSIAEMVVRG
jgi:putative peptidoglycan lipid II flippase